MPSARRVTTSTMGNDLTGEVSTPRNAFEKARLSMELSRQKVYAARSKKSRSIMMYTGGSVSSPNLDISTCVP